MALRERVNRLTLAALIWVSLWAIAGVAIFHRASVATTELSHAQSFSLGGLGGPSRESLDLQWLLRVPGAERRFSQLLSAESPAARLFGACGLQVIGSDRFEAAREQLARDDSELLVFYGCLGSSSHLRDLSSELPQLCSHIRASGFEWARAEIGRLVER